MKLILAGYEGSKKIILESAYLIKKYLPDFEVYFLNYGGLPFKLKHAQYVSLDDKQNGGSAAWSKYIANYLKTLDDDFVIFGLDDYLINGEMDIEAYSDLYYMFYDGDVVCARLCTSDFYNDFVDLGNGIIILGDSVEYSVTTQYCIWRRKYLIELLMQTTDPWDFEIRGSKILNRSGKKVIGMEHPIIPYYNNSALSPKWGNKIKIEGVKQQDVDRFIDWGWIKKDDMI